MSHSQSEGRSNLTDFCPVTLNYQLKYVIDNAIKWHYFSILLAAGYLAPDLIKALVQKWTEGNSRSEVTMTVLDVKAAFDPVWHQGSQVKLKSMGIKGVWS